MTAETRANSQEPWWARERIWALAIVIVLHLLALYGLTPPPPQLPETEEVAMELVFLIRLPRPEVGKSLHTAPKPRTKITMPPATAVNGSDTSNTDDALEVQDTHVPDVTQGLPASASLTQGDDIWDRPARAAAHGLTFRRDPLRSAPNPLASARPERFRMRKQLTPHEIVRGVSQLLGFWPPGYTDDPCGGIRRSVELLSGSTDNSSHWQLIEAIKAEQKYCQ